MFRSAFILSLIFISFDLQAQVFTPNQDWRFQNFNNQNHFISREINDLAMDKHGYLWACSRGVQRFDGYRTVDFNRFNQAKGGLRDNTTTCITDDSGRVWISSNGLCYYDEGNGKFVYVDPDPNHPITGVFAFCLQKNYLWFICEYGLAHINTRTLKISFTSLKEVVNPLYIFSSDDTTLLVSSREKMYIYDIKNDRYRANTLIYNQSLVKIFTATKTGSTFFLGTNKGLFTLKNLKSISAEGPETNDIIINDMLFLPQDKEKKYLFLATDGKGILVYNTYLKKIVCNYIHDSANPFSLPNDVISKIFVDKEGRLWAATDLGVSMLDVFSQQLKMRYLSKNNSDWLSIDRIAKDKYDNTKVWMSGYNQGMLRLNWKTKQVEKIYNSYPAMRKILDFTQLSKNKWLLTTQDKVIEWDSERGTIIENKITGPDSIRLTCIIRKIIATDLNGCFITTSRGLFKYDRLKHTVNAAFVNDQYGRTTDPYSYDLLNGFYDNGLLWIASRKGLFSYKVSDHTGVVYRGKGEKADYFLFDITPAQNNQLVCTSGDGITIFNKKTKNFEVVNTIANLVKPFCVSIACLNKTVWIGTEAGILNYNLQTHQSETAEHEAELMQIYPTSPFTIIDKEIVLGFRNGFASFTPDGKSISVPSDPLIEGVYVNNEPMAQKYASPGEAPAFDHADNSINITFTAFFYTDPSHIHFRYRLKGADPRWQYADEVRSANYAQLGPGSYTFYVQCGNKNGVWNNHLTSFSFIIQPPYWETWWFRMIVTLVIATALYGLYRYRIKNLLAIQRIREKIAADFHDDIGSALSSISIFSEVADTQLEEKLPHEQTREIINHISFYSRTMLDAMDDIIWAVNPRNDHFNDLAVRMREFAIPLLEAKNIHFDIHIDENILNARIKMEARKNVFLVFKECINNIIKHSGCSAMKLSVTKLNSQLELVITDNGKGFDINAPSTRNGLKNMKKRAEEINGAITITSSPGEGTVTRLLINIV